MPRSTLGLRTRLAEIGQQLEDGALGDDRTT
jgi:hypothetical protein